jgi:branched-chain amino acid transport system permease protein
MYALVALGVTMTFGLMDIVNFAHGQFVMMGAFFCYLSITLLGMNFFIASLVSIFLTFAVGIILERYTYRFARLNPINGLMISIGLIFVLENLVIILWGVETKTIVPAFPGVIKFFDLVLARQRLFAFLCSALLIILFFIFLSKTKLGKALRAIPQEREAAELMGINIDRITGFSFGLGCALAAIAGILLGSLFIVTPFMGERPLVKSFIIITLGGFGSIPGAVIGALIIGVLETLAAVFISSEWQDAFGFVILILVLMVKPMGLFGER